MILYKYLNSQQAIRDSIMAYQRQDGVITQDPIEMLELLNKNFQETFVIEDYDSLPYFEQRTNEKIDMVPDDTKYQNVLEI